MARGPTVTVINVSASMFVYMHEASQSSYSLLKIT